MKGIYKFAEHTIEVDSIHERVHTMCKGYESHDEAEFFINITQNDIEFERETADNTYSDDYLETLAVYRKVCGALIREDIVLCHGSAIAVDGEAFLFTAKSGTGKSTHTRLWREYFGEKAIMVNDDKPLLKVKNSGVTVYGTPWNGKHRLGNNISMPLKAICILERSETNHIREITLRQAYPMLVQQIYRFRSANEAAITFKLIDLLGETVRFYRLGCNMEQEAVRVAYEGMKG